MHHASRKSGLFSPRREVLAKDHSDLRDPVMGYLIYVVSNSLIFNILPASYLNSIFCERNHWTAPSNSNAINDLRTRSRNQETNQILANSLLCNILHINYLDSIFCGRKRDSIDSKPSRINILRSNLGKSRCDAPVAEKTAEDRTPKARSLIISVPD